MLEAVKNRHHRNSDVKFVIGNIEPPAQGFDVAVDGAVADLTLLAHQARSSRRKLTFAARQMHRH
jgi:hypothetical protein